MNQIEVVNSFIKASDDDDYDSAAEFLADDFIFSGPVPEPMSKEQYVGFMKTMAVAFPDWSFNVSGVTENTDHVEVTINITGTHTGNWDMTAAGGGVVPATGKAFKLPPGIGKYYVRDGKISALKGDPNPEAGVGAIMAQLGLSPEG